MGRRFLFTSILVILAATGVRPAAALVPGDIASIATVGLADLSPHGDRLIYALTTPATDGPPVTEYRMREMDSGADHLLFAADEHLSGPVFSPGGARIACIRHGDNGPTLVLVSEDFRHDVCTHEALGGALQWSPSGQFVAWLTDAPVGDYKGSDGVVVADGLGYRHLNHGYREGRLVQLYVCDLADGAVRRIVDAPLDLTAFAWSPDSRELVFAAKRATDLGHNLNQDLFLVDRNGGAPRAITMNPAADKSPVWLPDGRIAYLRADEPLYEADESIIAIIDPTNGDETILDRKAVGFPNFIWKFWYADGGFYFAAFNHGCIDVFAAGRAEPLTRTSHDFWSVDIGGGRMVLGGQDMVTPSALFEVSLLGTQTGPLDKIIDPNTTWYGDVKLYVPHTFATVVEGRTINGWYFLPDGWRAGDRAPTVLSIHGGPEWMYGGWWQHDFHILAEAGYAVLLANPTGSSGYGAEFRRAVRGDWQGAPARDLLGCVDWAVARGWADPDRLAVMGGSYGGYMAAWLTTQTDRFKASVIDRMVSDLTSFWGTTDEKWSAEWSCGGRPWDETARDYYRDASPLHHAGSVNTPTLISHGLRDYRCLAGQAESWFSALQSRGVPSRFLRFNSEAHGVRETDNRIRLAEEVLAWLDRYVRD